MDDTRGPEPSSPGAELLEKMAGKGHVLSAECPSRAILKHLTSQWGVLALVVLLTGTHRFSELRRKMGGVSERMLAKTLKTLEEDGFVLRVSFPVVPPHVEYSLTPLGREAGEKVGVLVGWIEQNYPRIAAAKTAVEEEVGADGGDPVESLDNSGRS